MTDEGTAAGDASPADETTPKLPDDVVARARELTRCARRDGGLSGAPAPEAALEQRDALLADHGYVARVRDDATLVLHPADWLDGGTVDPERIDTDDAVTTPLDAPPDDSAADPAARNLAVVERVRDRHGAPHGATAAAFAEYMTNHHAKPIAHATAREIETFREEYFVRNAWPSDAQRAQLDASITHILAAAEAERDVRRAATGDAPATDGARESSGDDTTVADG